ncbi:DUF6318 family protein [Aeromicrobium terrae]|uniref:DUF6318 domain-containing protein n=1 Tax=Aeromicrobium terrae TaxID=2498846 RepID=A0A5C8NN16_9ACTN|nr:DUF6318 family protein [Aeromicrobium terrae]TXL63214.1 hypothetical protein FHP06_03030 [Aeromicrobium terrae]
MRIVTLAIAGLLLFSGCSSDPRPIEPPRKSATPTLAPPDLPNEAKKDTPSGAATFVGFWVSAFNYAAKTGDGHLMVKHAPKCKPCREYAGDFKSLKQSERPKGAAWTLNDVRVGGSRDPIEVVTEVKVEGEKALVPLTFVLNDHAPFQLVDIYRRGT